MIEGRTGPWETVDRARGPRPGDLEGPSCFPGAATEFGAEPNTQVLAGSTAAFPGMLPVINRHCVEQSGFKTGPRPRRRRST